MQFNKEAIEQQLPEHGIQYLWLGKELGGLRKRDKSSEANAGDKLNFLQGLVHSGTKAYHSNAPLHTEGAGHCYGWGSSVAGNHRVQTSR